LVNLWFGWMNVGFDGWFMFGMMFTDDWGLMEFLERSLREERVVVSEWERRDFFEGIEAWYRARSCHP
jgi:hypothetical protein